MKQNPIPKTMALILVSLVGAWLLLRFDAWKLGKLETMTVAEIVQQERELHLHSFLHHFVWLVVFGGFYLGFVEFFTYVIGLFFPKQTPAEPL